MTPKLVLWSMAKPKHKKKTERKKGETESLAYERLPNMNLYAADAYVSICSQFIHIDIQVSKWIKPHPLSSKSIHALFFFARFFLNITKNHSLLNELNGIQTKHFHVERKTGGKTVQPNTIVLLNGLMVEKEKRETKYMKKMNKNKSYFG